MKLLYLLLILFLLSSCDETRYSTIIVKNKTQSLILEDIRWHDGQLAWTLSPNEWRSRNFNCDIDTIFNKPSTIVMKMRGANGVATVQTLQVWTLAEEDTTTIIITDTTSLIKP